tara:strand:+ start:186 stop:857 length:672 start_codon:yes stop_codon:yes gene_type:complete
MKDFYVHQIFWDFNGNGMNSLFQDSKEQFEIWCSVNGYEYKLWTEKECDELILEYPQYLDIYLTARYRIMKIDILRFLMLHKFGGLYADLDVVPQIKKVKKEKDLYFVLDKCNAGRSKQYITNEVLQVSKGHSLPISYLDYVVEQVKEKSDMEIYKVWKGRYVLQTTGVYAFTRYLNLNNYDYDFYTTNQLEFKKGTWDCIGLGDWKNVDFKTHESNSWENAL